MQIRILVDLKDETGDSDWFVPAGTLMDVDSTEDYYYIATTLDGKLCTAVDFDDCEVYAPIENPFEKEVVFIADCWDFNRLIEKVYGQPFDIDGDEESENGTYLSYLIFEEELDEYDTGKLVEFTETGDHQYITRVLLQDLVNHGVLEPGRFLISVSW